MHVPGEWEGGRIRLTTGTCVDLGGYSAAVHCIGEVYRAAGDSVCLYPLTGLFWRGASGLGVVTDTLIHLNFRPCRYLL